MTPWTRERLERLRKEQRHKGERTQLRLPVPDPPRRRAEPTPDEPSTRGVTIIQL